MARNIGNYSTFNHVLSDGIDIQSTSSTAFKVYSSDPTNPIFTIDGTTGNSNFYGTLNALGTFNSSHTNITQSDSSLFQVSATNTTDTVDIGLIGQWGNGTIYYTGIARIASDSGRGWAVFDNIATQPVTTVPGLTSTNYSPFHAKSFFANSGAVGTPSYSFNSSTTTGLYLSGSNSLGVAANGIKVADIGYSGSSTFMTLDTTTTLNLKTVSTINDAASPTTPAVTTGSVNVASASAANRWWNNWSNTTAATPSYCGTVFGSPSTQFFVTNTGSALEFSTVSGTFTGTSIPDYRAKTALFSATSTNFTSGLTFLNKNGANGSPSYSFTNDTTTGAYLSSGGTYVISASSTDVATFKSAQSVISNDLKTNAGNVISARQFSGTSLTLDATYNLVECTNSGSITVTLPAVSSNVGRQYNIINAGTGSTTVAVSGADHIDDGVKTSIALTSQYAKLTIVAGVSQWYSV